MSPARVAGWAVLAVAVVAAVVVALVVALAPGGDGQLSAGNVAASGRPSSAAPPASTPARTSTGTSTSPSVAPSTSAKPARIVRVTSMLSDGATYGVGMPIVFFLSPAPTSAAAFERAVTVTVNGKPAGGAWNWSQPTADDVDSNTIEAHYRTQGYWPAHSRIHVSTPIGGLSAGRGLEYSGKLTSLDFDIGAAHVSTVNANGLSMTVRSDGRVVHRMPVSLGEANYPTFNGTKIVMQKGENVPGSDRLRPNGTVLMSGAGYTDDPVQWSVRITRSGEYVHAAPWNGEIGARSTSHGCTNLRTAAARWFYQFSRVGDVVTYANTDGKTMPSWDGLGDWNVPWTQWQRGGLLRG